MDAVRKEYLPSKKREKIPIKGSQSSMSEETIQLYYSTSKSLVKSV
jgi:hypothetical protein